MDYYIFYFIYKLRRGIIFKRLSLHFIIFLAIPFILTSCSLGAKYEIPPIPVPYNWSSVTAQKLAISNDEAWWRNFHDPLLNNLIEQHAVSNLNLKTARARVKAARAEYAVVSAQLFPTAGLSALPPTGTGAAINQLIALSVALDPDIFGKIRHNRKRAKAILEAEEAEYDFTINNLYAEIATSYLELREAQARNTVIQHNLSGNKQTLHLIKSRYQSGYANYINIAQQEGLLETQQAELEQNKALITAAIHKIELLTGHYPGILTQQLSEPKPVPQIKQNINLGLPSELLRRRPDIIAAERRIAAAHANIRVAIANLLPQVTVGWLIGWQTQTLASNLVAVQNPDSTLFGTLAAPIFNLTNYRTIDVRKREKILAVLNYQMTILRALHEVEAHYNLYQHYEKSAYHFKKAIAQKQTVLKLARNAYQKGTSDFNIVLRSEEEVNQIEFSYLQNIVKAQQAKINLYKALGGNIYR